MAVGQNSGETLLLRIDDKSNDVIGLPVKHQRACNTVTFNTNGLLATGLDRVRNDFCLNVWDVNQRLTSWEREKVGWGGMGGSVGKPPSPVRSLAGSETVTSVKWFTDAPMTLVAGVGNKYMRLYDLRGKQAQRGHHIGCESDVSALPQSPPAIQRYHSTASAFITSP